MGRVNNSGLTLVNHVSICYGSDTAIRQTEVGHQWQRKVSRLHCEKSSKNPSTRRSWDTQIPTIHRDIAQVDGPKGLRPTLERMLAMTGGWFCSSPAQRHVLGALSPNYVAKLSKLSSGQGALLAVRSHSSQSSPGANLGSLVEAILAGYKSAARSEPVGLPLPRA